MAGPAAVPGVDPSRVNTPDELAACLDGLRRRAACRTRRWRKRPRSCGPDRAGHGWSRCPRARWERSLPASGCPPRASCSLSLPCARSPRPTYAQWLAAWERARTADLARPAGAVRVRDARPRLLGVHAAIQVDEEVPGELPVYVPRDVDDGLRAGLAAGAQRGCFVLLIGGSSVGKTRTLYEAVLAALPEWWLVHPAGPGEVAALAQAPPPRTVVWLDELQRYLDGEDGLTGGVVRALLTPRPVVIIGTLWPDRYSTYTAVPAPGGPDPRAREREVLDLADVVRIAPEFSPAEQDRARAAADGDRRLAVALGAAGYGLTQTLAAAPQLVARWEDARAADPYAWAVLTAALDVARLGGRAPLPADLLRAAAPGYCTSAQQAEAPASWFEQALAYATAKLHGAAAALAPAAGAGMGQVTGYTVADYLLQHASRERRPARVPASTWDALLSHLRDPADAARLADSAHGRLLYRYAIPLYRRAADAGDTGDGHAAGQLVELLSQRGDLDELRARADAGDDNGVAAWRLAGLLADRGDLDELRARADADDRYAAERLAEAAGPSAASVDRLRARADAGDRAAAGRARSIRRRGRAGAATWTSCGPGPTPATGPPPCSWPSCWPSAGTWIRPSRSARPGRRRRRVRRQAAGRAAGRPRGPGPAARPGRRRRPVCRLAAGRAAGRVRGDLDELRRPDRRHAAGRAAGRPWGPGRAARPGRRRRRVRRHAAGRAAGRPRGPGRAAGPGRRRRRVRRLADWSSCWSAAGIWTSCAPGPTPATRAPPCGWPGCWPSAGTWTRPSRSGAPGPTPTTRPPPCSWPGCWPTAGTWIRPSSSCAPGPTPATGTPPCSWPSSWPGCWRGGARARKRSGCAGSA